MGRSLSWDYPTEIWGYGFRAHAKGARPGMTGWRTARKNPGIAAGVLYSWVVACEAGSEIHAAHAAARGHAGAGALVLLRHFGHHGLGGDQKCRNRSCVLDRRANHLGRVDDALGDQVDIFASLRVEAVGILILLEDLADDHRAVFTGVDRDLASGPGERLAHDLDAGLLVVVLGLDALQLLGGAQQGDAAARYDAFFNRRTGRMHRVIHAVLALLHLDFRRAADADHRDAARELGQTLLQLLTVVVRRGFLDLRLDLRNARLDVGLLAGAVDDGGVFLVDHHLLCAHQHGERDVLELDAEIFRDRLTTGQNRDVLQHGLATIAEARSLDGCDLRPPRRRLTTRVASASPSTSSA